MSRVVSQISLAAALALAFALCASEASAEEILLFGDVGHSPVMMTLERDGAKLDGWYLYLHEAKEIEIDGAASADGRFTLQEKIGGHVTATFKGQAKDGVWTGDWQKSGGTSSLPFQLSENHDRLAHLNAQVRCTTRTINKQFAMTTTHELDMRIAHGAVSKLELTRATRAQDGDEQSCSIGTSDLVRETSRTGILLRSKEDRPEQAGAPHCTVRITGDERFLYVRMGDPQDANNDCRQSGDMMYCSSRAFWTDMVIDRRSGTCKSVE